MKSKDSQKFTEYYRKQRVTGTYDKQREGTPYRRKKRAIELKYFLELIDKKPNEFVKREDKIEAIKDYYFLKSL